MKTKFIITEDKLENQYLINVDEIALIEEIDGKYKRIITLNVLDENGNQKIIESTHSIKELEKKIKEA